MTFIVTAVFDTDLETLAASEQAHPEAIAAIGEIAKDYMIGHQRHARDGQVMDIDTYRTADDYRAFFAKAEPHIKQYVANAGTTVTDTMWEVID